ncbi:hypothetical protein FQN57_000509 [Myotisia sp. PD_48]|nr:hypothetical protein FQN57_000509 [Myotisia sp. PD_48]
MASDTAGMEADMKEFRFQLENVESSLQVEPNNTELQSLKAELEELISLTQQSIEDLRPAPASNLAPSPRSPVKEKWSKESHPAYQAGYRKPANDPIPTEESQVSPTSFAVNENVLARWVSGDNTFYPARITSITGSSTNPVYIVSFKSYSTTETLNAKDIKPISSNNNNFTPNNNNNNNNTNNTNINNNTTNNDPKKRKADATSTSGLSTPQPASSSDPSVISAAADINPDLANQARTTTPSTFPDGSPRPTKQPRKVKAKRDLEAGKNKWHDFTNKSKFGKSAKKDSMFRTPEGIHARVGFTGSGQQMRKDPTRTKHIYSQEDDIY